MKTLSTKPRIDLEWGRFASQLFGSFWVLLTLLAAGGCTQAPGEVSVSIAWPEQGTAPNEVFLRGQVQVEGGAQIVTGPVIGPVGFGEAARLPVEGVPNGSGHRVVAEVTAAADSELVLFAGVSEPFDVFPGDEVTVDVQLFSPPRVEGSSNLALDGGDVPRNDPNVVLIVETDTGVTAEISNLPGFADENVTVVNLASAEGASATCPPATPSAGARCVYRIPWNLDTDVGACTADLCRRQVFVRFRDARGFRSDAVSTLATLDVVAPTLVDVAATYAPGQSSVLSNVTAAGDGAEVRLTALASELLFGELTMTARHGDRSIVLTPEGLPEEGSRSPTATVRVDERFVDGTYDLELSIRDFAGNRNPSAVFPAAFVVDRTAGALSVDQAAVSFVRSPAGRPVPERTEPPAGGEAPYVIPAGPTYFALAPADPLDGRSHLSLETFALEGEVPTLIRVWADAEQRNLLQAASPKSEGWARDDLTLASLDTRQAFVTGVDRAGNESAPVPIQSTWFVAASGPDSLGNRVHPVTQASDAPPPQGEAAGLLDPSLVEAPDGRAVAAASAYAWRETDDMRPSSRAGFMAAFDAGRGRVVVFGGQSRNDTWEFDGSTWQEIDPRTGRPPNRANGGIAYDALRGRVLLYGGRNQDETLQDTWSWNGEAWSSVMTSTAPPRRFFSRMAYDSARDRMVIFGGQTLTGTVSSWLRDTWEFDGTDWIRMDPPGPLPPARGRAAMAYDPERQVTVLFGGLCGSLDELCGDTWEWDGAVWRERSPSASPAPREIAAMGFDPVRNQIVLFGGVDVDSEPSGRFDTPWYWDGTTWTEVDVGAPPFDTEALISSGLVLMSDPAGAGVLLVMVPGITEPITAYSLSSATGWRQLTGSMPGARYSPGLVYDGARQQAVLWGGSDEQLDSTVSGTWVHDGASWRQLTLPPPFPGFPGSAIPEPPLRTEHAMAYDPVRERVVLFGGQTVGPNGSSLFGDTWEFDGSAWRQIATSTAPSPRAGHQLAYDSNLGEVILFGGTVGFELVPPFPGTPFRISAPIFSDETWAFDGTNWSRLEPAASPPGLGSHEMVHDAARGRVVLVAGQSRECPFGFCSLQAPETWEWDGSTWVRTATQIRTPVRETTNFSLVYDARRQRVITYGGDQDRNVSETYDDVWAYDGRSWREVTPATAPPTRYGSAMVHHGASGRTLMFGGADFTNSFETFNRTWFLDAPRQPTLQFAAQLPVGIPREAWRAARLRVRCGGAGPDGAGANLMGWDTVRGNGAFLPLGSNAQSTEFDPSVPRDGEIDVTVPAVNLLGPEGRMYLRCQPESQAAGGTATVAADYFEIRANYVLD